MSYAASPGLFMSPGPEQERVRRSDAPSLQPEGSDTNPRSHLPQACVIDLTAETIYKIGNENMTKRQAQEEFASLRAKYSKIFLRASNAAEADSNLQLKLLGTSKAMREDSVSEILVGDKKLWAPQHTAAKNALLAEMARIDEFEYPFKRPEDEPVVAALAEARRMRQKRLTVVEKDIDKRRNIIERMLALRKVLMDESE